MRNFSIIPNSNQTVVDQYSDYLSKEVYTNMQPHNVDDPLFLQKLGVLQAEGIRRAINNNTGAIKGSLNETKVAVLESSELTTNKIGSVADMITSSLDRGFSTLNSNLLKFDYGIETVNTNLSNIHSGINTINKGIDDTNKNIYALTNITAQGLNAINNNLSSLQNMVGFGFFRLCTQIAISNKLLGDAIEELRIPETQRERRFHIEEGSKFLSIALEKGDKLYFEDALDEFNKAISIERKDFYSWFNLGIIHLLSPEHLDINKAINSFERFIHYATAELAYKKDINLELKVEEAHLHLSEAYYLNQELLEAVVQTEQCIKLKTKADFLKVKYLSANNLKSKKLQAAKILSQLISTNPYITLQVLADDDIIGNENIIELLEEIRQVTHKKASDMFIDTKKHLRTKLAINQTREIVNEIKTLLQSQTLLDSHEAIILMEKPHVWNARNGRRFFSRLSDINIKEKIIIDNEFIYNTFDSLIGIRIYSKWPRNSQIIGSADKFISAYDIYEKEKERWERLSLSPLLKPKIGNYSEAYYLDCVKITIWDARQTVSQIEINCPTYKFSAFKSKLVRYGVNDLKLALLGKKQNEIIERFGKPESYNTSIVSYKLKDSLRNFLFIFDPTKDECVGLRLE